MSVSAPTPVSPDVNLNSLCSIKKKQTLVSPLKQRWLGTQSLSGEQRFQRTEEEGIYIFQKTTCKSPSFFSIPRNPQPFPPSGLPPPDTLFSYFPLCSLSRLSPGSTCPQQNSVVIPCFPVSCQIKPSGMFSPSQGLIIFLYSDTGFSERGWGVGWLYQLGSNKEQGES